MSSIFQAIISYILIYRYTALFVVSFISSLGVPLPAAASAVAAAAFANQGFLNVFWLGVVGALGNISGDITMYLLMRRYGKKLLIKLRLKKIAESPLLHNVEQTVETYKAWIIISSRFQDQTTTIVNIIAGIGKMDFKKFAFLVTVGDLLQISFYIAIGFLFADNWQSVYGAVGKFGWIVGLALSLIIIFFSTRTIKNILKK